MVYLLGWFLAGFVGMAFSAWRTGTIVRSDMLFLVFGPIGLVEIIEATVRLVCRSVDSIPHTLWRRGEGFWFQSGNRR